MMRLFFIKIDNQFNPSPYVKCKSLMSLINKSTVSAYKFCCIYSNTFQNIFVMEANSMNPDQTAP